MAEDCVFVGEKRGTVWVDVKEKDLVARYVEEGADKDFWQARKEEDDEGLLANSAVGSPSGMAT